MAQYATLKAAIDAVIKANGQREITGTVLNQTLNAMVNSLGANYQFVGVATPSTNPGTPDQNVFYLAGQGGTYTNFNNIAIPNGISFLLWNGSWSSQTVLSGDGGVFDISAYKATGGTLATFADLSAALGENGANVPIKFGGMQVRFVSSSDNNYVQYRYMGTEITGSPNPFLDTANWQGVDDEPTNGSKNLVESGGVHRRLVQIDDNTLKSSNGNINTLNADYTGGVLKNSNGTIDNRYSEYRTSDYIALDNFLYLAYNNVFPNVGAHQGLCFYDENKQFIPYSAGLPTAAILINHGIIDLSEIPNVKFARFANSDPTLVNDSYVILSKTEDVSIIDYEDLLNSVGVSKSIGNFDTVTYGDTSDNVGGSVIGGTDEAIFTIENGYSTVTGILSKITVNVASAGTLTCFVGLLDQRRNMVNQREFTISIPQAGLNTIDILDKNIAIEEGEQIFIATNRSAGMLPRFKKLSESINCQAMSSFGYQGQDFTTFYEQSSTVFPYGISISLSYEVSLYEGRFATKEEVSIIKNEVDTLAEQVNLSGVVYDSDGHPFKIVVVNNQLVPKSLLYRKVVALGNSLTDHPYSSSLGWLTKDYSMAATKMEMSWTSQLEKRLKTYYTDAQVIPFNIYQWEQNPAINPSTIYKNDGISQNNIYLSEVLTSDVDCVIFRAGENNPSTPQTQQDYEDGLTSLINYIKQRCPTADIVISSLMWHKTMRDTAFRNVANTFGLKYVDTGTSGSQRETLGDFCLSYDNTTYFPIISAGVANHVNDYGFYMFANILINAFGMTPLNEQHTILVESSVTYYMNRVIGIKNGIITIQTYGNNAPTITVVDADSNVISVTHRNMSEYSLGSNPPTFCSTFIMPDSDVTVTIS